MCKKQEEEEEDCASYRGLLLLLLMHEREKLESEGVRIVAIPFSSHVPLDKQIEVQGQR